MNKLPFERIERKILTKIEAETNSDFGCKPEKRSVKDLISYGVVNLNKVSGPTSHQVTDYVKKIFHVKKAGHSGTLDPKVTGVLPIALDKGTRIVQVLLTAGKEYVCLMYLHKKIPEEKIRSMFNDYLGEIKQIPPVRSAVKRVERKRTIYYVDILEIDGQNVLFRMGCQAGTYVRKYVHDFGKKIGCNAHMVQLVRTKAGPFKDKNMFTLHDLKDAYEYWKEGNEKEIRKFVLPFEKAVDHLGKVWISDGAVDPVCHGSDLYVAGISKLNDKIHKNDMIAVMTLKDELVCIGKAEMDSDEILERKRGIVVKTKKVLMDRGTYIS